MAVAFDSAAHPSTILMSSHFGTETVQQLSKKIHSLDRRCKGVPERGRKMGRRILRKKILRAKGRIFKRAAILLMSRQMAS